jgi:hypothetical protein
MADPGSVLVAGTEALSLAAQLARLIEDSEASEENRESLNEIFDRLRPEARSISRNMGNSLRAMIEELDSWGIDPNRTINYLLEDLSWYNFVTRSRLNSVRSRFYATHRQLATFIDDVSAVLVCSGTAQSASKPPIYRTLRAQPLRVMLASQGVFHVPS